MITTSPDKMSVTLTVGQLDELIFDACTRAVAMALASKAPDQPEVGYGMRDFMRITGWGRTKASQAINSGDFDKVVDRSRRPMVINIPRLIKMVKP